MQGTCGAAARFVFSARNVKAEIRASLRGACEAACNITEGIPRARDHISTAKVVLIEPGKVYEYRIDLWSTANVFRKGHRIRLEVSSSNFPRFDRNPNTGNTTAESAELVKATNTVLHDLDHARATGLPIAIR